MKTISGGDERPRTFPTNNDAVSEILMNWPPKNKWILMVYMIIMILVLALMKPIYRGIFEGISDWGHKRELVTKAVQEMSPFLPKQLNSQITWTAIMADGGTLVYFYQIHSHIPAEKIPVVTENLTERIACNDNMVEPRKLLKLGVKARYVINDTGGTLFSFEVSEFDCVGATRPDQVQ